MAEPRVEEYVSKANVVVDQSLDSTRRIRQMAEETVECAIKTTEELAVQGVVWLIMIGNNSFNCEICDLF